MNTSPNDVTPRDPAATEPASAAPDDQALADILESDPAEPVEPGLLPAPRRPVAGWLIGVGAVVVVGAVIAAVALVPKAPGPASSTPEPSLTVSTNGDASPSGVQLVKVITLPENSNWTPNTTGGYTLVYEIVNPSGDDSLTQVEAPGPDGKTYGPCPIPAGLSRIAGTITINPDGTFTCGSDTTLSTGVQLVNVIVSPADGHTPPVIVGQGTINPDGTSTYATYATTTGSVVTIWFLNSDGTVSASCDFPSDATGPATVSVLVAADGTVTCSTP